ncbi:DUF4123 domain-containing protein [Yoonia sp. 2307UL14-13]|uniref:DUF4123 domain-containing protein n=1 Tax=Yoonia sp. 2307UL14-13 TaxID=3126506 RepID=UPI0030ACD212
MTSDASDNPPLDLPPSISPPPEQEALELGIEAAVFDPLDADAAALEEAGDTETLPLKAYLMLDASVDPDIPVCIEAFNSPSRCLFDGDAFDQLAEVGPWLVEVKRYDDAWDWFVEDGLGNDWGIIIHTRLPLMRLKVQMKKFIKIEDEEGETYFFKFYRPEHFNTYIPAFDDDQIARFSRGVEAFFAETVDPAHHLTHHKVVDGKFQSENIDLVALGEPLRIKPPSPEDAQALIDEVIQDMKGS